MKIALFSDSFLPVPNGVSIAVRGLAKELRGLGYKVYIFAPTFRGYEDTDPNVLRLPSIQPPVAYRYPLALPVSPRIIDAFGQLGIDIVHTHTPFFTGMAARSLAKRAGLPLVSTYHTLYENYIHYVPFIPKVIVRSMLRYYLQYYYRKCDTLITPSQAALDSLRAHNVTKAATIIPTAIPEAPAFDRHVQRKALGVDDGTLMMLYVGRLALEKNTPFLLRSLKPILDKNPNCALWLVGAGPLLDHIARLAKKLGIDRQVHIVGGMPREEVNRYYAAADLFVFPSTSETQGLVIGEAQTYGLPCVAVEGGGASEAMRPNETGFVVPNEETLFTQAVEKLIYDEPLRKQFSANSANQSVIYTPQSMARRVVEVYESVLSPNANRSLIKSS
jgi:glycosyltransferase involved in cell wall biosynthesis